jgi:hypothetical protein
MICARAEAWALVVKAARGAGVPIGQAEDLAATMIIAPVEAWLELPAALSDPMTLDGPVERDQLIYSNARTVMDGPSAIDAALMGQEVYLGGLDAPLTFVIMCYAAEASTSTGLEFLFDDEGGILLRMSLSAAPKRDEAAGHIDVPDQVWGFLNLLAAKTYVPETAASRAKGAGAGLTDND